VPSENSDRRLNIRVKPSDLALLAALAKAVGLSKTGAVRLALRQLALERGIDPDDPRKRRPAPAGPTVPAVTAEPGLSLLGIARMAATTAEAAAEVARVTGWSPEIAATFARGARVAVESPPPPPASPRDDPKDAPKGPPRRRAAP
jgi:hypothetical protein